MKKNSLRFISILLSIVMIVGTVAIGFTVFADYEPVGEAQHKDLETDEVTDCSFTDHYEILEIDDENYEKKHNSFCVCGNKKLEDHNWAYEDLGNGKHKVYCADCGFFSKNEEHDVIEDSYSYASTTTHNLKCKKCGDAVEPHNFNTDTHKCENCGYVYDCGKSGHIPVYSNEFNDDTHSMHCAACGFSWKERHNYDTDTRKCTVCGHTHNGCNIDGHYFLKLNDDKHKCVFCGAETDHNLNTFGTCKDCGHHDCKGFGHVYMGGFESDENYHWKLCDYCGVIDSDGSHTYEPDNTKEDHVDANRDGQCDKCGYYCGHKWQLTGHSDPTCTGAGSDEYTCYFCGDTNSKDIAPLGHYWFDDTKVSDEDREYVDFEFSSNYESCTLTFKCRRPECGHTVSYTVYTDPTDTGAVLANPETKRAISKQVAPDCINGSGLRYYAIFTVSGVLREMNLDISDPIVDPDHPENDRPGMMTIKQYIALDSDLKDILGENGEKLDPKINANEKGFICMVTVPDGELPALGHIYENKDYMRYQDEEGNWIEGANYQPNGDASCTKDGTRVAPCDRPGCGKINDKVPDVGSALGHDFNYDNPTVPATCTEDGLCICSRCKEEVVLPKLDHNWVKDESKHVEPTCSSEGSDFYECSRCHETKTETIASLPHNFDETVTPRETDPTCTEQGYTEKYCTICKQYVKTDFTPALGHVEPEAPVKENNVDSNCETGGKYDEVYYCTRCGEEIRRETITVPATGHVFKYAPEDEDHHVATCEICGFTAGRSFTHVDADYDFICDDCGAEINFWHHWLHYMVGFPNWGFSRGTKSFMDVFTAIVHFFTKYMINF